jgi:protein gp37
MLGQDRAECEANRIEESAMGIKTKIEYCDSTINPTPCCSGCELYSPDPAKNHCYAAVLVNRYKGLKGWPDSFTEFKLFEQRIPQACGWPDLTGKARPDKPWLDGYPRVVFLNDLGDGFAPIAPLDWALPYIEMMEASPHIWLWLTKWPRRMVKFFEQLGYAPSNFWLGTSITSQKTTWRVKELLKLHGKASILWLSYEPLLGPVDIDHRIHFLEYRGLGEEGYPIHWIADGGESGINARPSHPDWHRGARDFCRVNGIEYFFKQWGEFAPYNAELHEPILADWKQRSGELILRDKVKFMHVSGSCDPTYKETTTMIEIGKSRAGRILDGVEHNGMPEAGQ